MVILRLLSFYVLGDLCLNKVRKNLAANLVRSPLMHSYYYASACDRTTLFAGFPLSFVPFAHYAG